MKERYVELMEKALSAYSDEHIRRYFDTVRAEGLKEHGFPRLAVNIGVLIAHGRRLDLTELFVQMMDFCTESFHKTKAANDFSVREVVYCLMLFEEKGCFTKELCRWKSELAKIVPESCYDIYAKTPDDKVNNWALFSALSEQARQIFIGCDSESFIDLQLENQLKRLDENGMYMDHLKSDVHQPMVYDLVPRFLFSLLLHFGYRGRHFEAIDSALRKAGVLTLAMQSATGEIAFGGRSNQFVHNEPMMTIVLEYEANRYAKEGNPELAARFKAAIARAIDVTDSYLSKDPIRHVKNRYPTETEYGCESYAYFDKYMITVASQLFMAYIICDDSIAAGEDCSFEPSVFATSEHFHKIFASCGGYSIELDTNADPRYDASGLGRAHRFGAPSAICLSHPCPKEPKFTIDVDTPPPLSICSGVKLDGNWRFASEGDAKYSLSELRTEKDAALVGLDCLIGDVSVSEKYTVSGDGVLVELASNGELALALPAFCFDGELEPDITLDSNTLTVSYDGWVCVYTASEKITDRGLIACNRNGHYRFCVTCGNNSLWLKVTIKKENE